MTQQLVAMHMSDGIINVPVSLMFAAIVVAALGFCGRRAQRELDERTVPLAGLVAAFIFAVQMVNFPILPGVSGHLLGGALAAILVGPYTGALCVSIVLVVQSLLFADGGITALGTNIANMSLLGVAAGYGTAVLAYRFTARLGPSAFLAAVVGTVCAAMGFVVEYAIGGAAPVALTAVAGYMFGTHLLIGIGEGVITALTVAAVARDRQRGDHTLTALTVAAVARARPDLVYLLRRTRREVPA